MAVIIAALFLMSLPDVMSDFLCPEIKECKCQEEMQWTDQVIVTASAVHCSFGGLQAVPDFRSLRGQKIDRLLLNGNNITELSSIDFSGLDVAEIDLSENPLKTIQNNTFLFQRECLKILILEKAGLLLDLGLYFLEGLVKLTDLSLIGNNIENEDGILPAGVFSNLILQSLDTLSIGDCHIGSMEEGALWGVESITIFDASFNYLEEVPLEVLRLTNLRDLNLYGNDITELRDRAFETLQYLKKVDLGVNDISIIATDVFYGLEDSLQVLDFYYNELSSVPTSALRNLTKLTSLTLSRNDISTITSDSLRGEHNIEHLFLDGNTLEFHDDMFYGVRDSLKTLSIKDMDLTKLPLGALGPLEKLTSLDAGENNIEEIDRRFFFRFKFGLYCIGI